MPADSETTSMSVLEMARAGQFDRIHGLFAPGLRTLITVDAIRTAWTAEIEKRGPVRSVGAPASEEVRPGVLVTRIPVRCERDSMTLVVTVTASGELAGLQLAPAGATEQGTAWEPPAYVDPATFDERDLTVGAGPLAVPGTLSLPRGTGPLPGIVLLAGSGPNDRDGTLGRNKVLRDLAWGLATRGVAVLRFDKVTHAHPREASSDAGFTVTDEYVPHAVAAVRLLEGEPTVDPGRVFVLGHSLGGTVAPRVAAADDSIAGLVLLAGGAQPMHWAAVRQVRYLASLDPAKAASLAPMIETLSRQAEAIDSPELSPSTPPTDLPFGIPVPYWLDLRAYDPAAAAAALDIPILVLQGGRDYQATVEDDLARWEAALAGRPGVTIRAFPADNHFFFPGTGPSSPAELEPAQHVDEAVVDEIAGWLGRVGRHTDPTPGVRA
jgi:uncharacterized protein